LAAAHDVGQRGGEADGGLELGEALDRRLLPHPGYESVEHEGDATVILLLELAHDGPSQPRPGAKVYAPRRVAGTVVAVADVLGRLADVGREDDAAGLVAGADGQVHGR